MATAGHYGQEEIATRLGRLSSMWAELKVIIQVCALYVGVVCGWSLWYGFRVEMVKYYRVNRHTLSHLGLPLAIPPPLPPTPFHSPYLPVSSLPLHAPSPPP